MQLGELIYTRDPRNGRRVAEFHVADTTEVSAACRAALNAHLTWRRQSPTKRAEALTAIARTIAERRHEFAACEARDTGKHLAVAEGEVDACVALWRYAAFLAQNDTLCQPGTGAYTVREPMRVVGMIVPWNYPLVTTSERLPFALAAGCSVVLKPSEIAAGAIPLLTEVVVRCPGIPNGLLHTVYGDARTGEALTLNPDVDMLAFVGSTATGRRVEKSAAAAGKRVSAEMGGNNYMLVYADADLERAADAAIRGAFRNAGQACIAATHVLISPQVKAPFTRMLVSALVRHHPLHERHTFQPMINLEHAKRVEQLIASACHEEQLRMLPESTPERRGSRVGPAVFVDVPPDSRLMRDEIFGPVLTVTPLAEEDFIATANASGYGLAAYVWTRSENTANKAVACLRAGRLWVNADPEAWIPELPVGGFGNSGTGRDLGPRALDTYSLTKSVLHG